MDEEAIRETLLLSGLSYFVLSFSDVSAQNLVCKGTSFY